MNTTKFLNRLAQLPVLVTMILLISFSFSFSSCSDDSHSNSLGIDIDDNGKQKGFELVEDGAKNETFLNQELDILTIKDHTKALYTTNKDEDAYEYLALHTRKLSLEDGLIIPSMDIKPTLIMGENSLPKVENDGNKYLVTENKTNFKYSFPTIEGSKEFDGYYTDQIVEGLLERKFDGKKFTMPHHKREGYNVETTFEKVSDDVLEVNGNFVNEVKVSVKHINTGKIVKSSKNDINDFNVKSMKAQSRRMTLYSDTILSQPSVKTTVLTREGRADADTLRIINSNETQKFEYTSVYRMYVLADEVPECGITKFDGKITVEILENWKAIYTAKGRLFNNCGEIVEDFTGKFEATLEVGASPEQGYTKTSNSFVLNGKIPVPSANIDIKHSLVDGTVDVANFFVNAPTTGEFNFGEYGTIVLDLPEVKTEIEKVSDPIDLGQVNAGFNRTGYTITAKIFAGNVVAPTKLESKRWIDVTEASCGPEKAGEYVSQTETHVLGKSTAKVVYKVTNNCNEDLGTKEFLGNQNWTLTGDKNRAFDNNNLGYEVIEELNDKSASATYKFDGLTITRNFGSTYSNKMLVKVLGENKSITLKSGKFVEYKSDVKTEENIVVDGKKANRLTITDFAIFAIGDQKFETSKSTFTVTHVLGCGPEKVGEFVSQTEAHSLGNSKLTLVYKMTNDCNEDLGSKEFYGTHNWTLVGEKNKGFNSNNGLNHTFSDEINGNSLIATHIVGNQTIVRNFSSTYNNKIVVRVGEENKDFFMKEGKFVRYEAQVSEPVVVTVNGKNYSRLSITDFAVFALDGKEYETSKSTFTVDEEVKDKEVENPNGKLLSTTVTKVVDPRSGNAQTLVLVKTFVYEKNTFYQVGNNPLKKRSNSLLQNSREVSDINTMVILGNGDVRLGKVQCEPNYWNYVVLEKDLYGQKTFHQHSNATDGKEWLIPVTSRINQDNLKLEIYDQKGNLLGSYDVENQLK